MKKHNNFNVARYAIIVAFGGFVFALDAGNISGTLRFVSSQFGLDSIQTGSLVSIALFGVICALFFTGKLCDKFGRKKVLLGIAATYSISTLLSAFALNYHMLLIGRFIGGVAFASVTVSAMYIGEIAPANSRGKYVSINQLLMGVGFLLAFIVNFFLVKWMANVEWLTNETVWRYMLGFELVPNILWFSLLLTIPESPRWLMLKGHTSQAQQVFSTIVPESEVDTVVKEVAASIDEDSRSTAIDQLKKLFSKPMMPIVFIAVVYGLAQGASGMNAVLFYAPTVFEQIGMSVQDTFARTIVLGLVAVVFTGVAIMTVEKLGRRFLTIFGLLLVFLAHTSTWYGFKSGSFEFDQAAIIELTEQNIDVSKLEPLVGKSYSSDVELKADLATIYDNTQLPLVSGPIINATIEISATFVLIGLFLFLAAFNMSIGPVMWVVFSEIFPNSIRSVAVPFAALVQTVGAYIIQQFFPWQLENLGAASTFLTYGIVALVGMIIMFFILPETKGKSIEEIEKQLMKA